jgi:hypothetical protein
MWGLLDEYANYIKVGFIVIVLCFCFYGGYHMGNSRYVEYKASVEATAKVQEAKIQSIQKQHELVTKGIQDEYEAKLSAVRNYYKSTSMWNKSSGSPMPGISATPSVSNVVTAYNELSGQCAQTTLQLIELQKWINEQVGIK